MVMKGEKSFNDVSFAPNWYD